MEIIQQYNPQAGNLTRSQQHKIKKILEHNCIERVGEFSYKINPIPGYNKTVYTAYKDFSWSKWKCSCQYFTKTGKECAHIAALKEYLKQWGEDGQKRLF